MNRLEHRVRKLEKRAKGDTGVVIIWCAPDQSEAEARLAYPRNIDPDDKVYFLRWGNPHDIIDELTAQESVE